MTYISEKIFLGYWKNESGCKMKIKSIRENILVDYQNEYGEFPKRNFLNPLQNNSAENMPAKIQNEILVVELGTAGLGPTLNLKLDEINKTSFLVPEIHMGLYDDFEDDFGAGWIFPLSRFKRI